MELTKIQKYRTYRSLALQFEKSRIDKGWSLEQAAAKSGEHLTILMGLEYGFNILHKLKLGNLMKYASYYDKLLKIEFVDPPKEDSKEEII